MGYSTIVSESSKRRNHRSSKGSRVIRSAACTVEMLEQRQLLAASVRALIPTLYTGVAPQTPLGDTVTQFQFPGVFIATAQYYRFATDDAAPGAITSIFTSRLLSTDAGIALFDAGGNLLQIADADATPSIPGSERLDATLQPKTPYILGIYSLATLNPLEVAISLPQQATNTPLKLDPATGVASLAATSGEDTFNSRTDPDYYPLDFFNGKANGVVTVSPVGLDVQSMVGVMQEVVQTTILAGVLPGTTAWQTLATASGASPTFNVAPNAGQNLADSKYLLSIAPLNFNSPARSYQIAASADTLAPASVDAVTPIALGTLLPTTLGQASLSKFVIFSSGEVYSFVAAATGPVTLDVVSPTVGTKLALYDATGQTLLAARGRTTNTAYSHTFDAVAGTTYRVALTPAVGTAGLATLVVKQAYAPEAISVVTGPLIQPGITVGGTAGAKFYRVALPAGSDVLSIRVAPADATGGTVTLSIIGNFANALTRTANAGLALNSLFDSRTFGRSVDIAFTSNNAAPIDFSIASISVAKTLPASTPVGTIDLITGDLSASVVASTPGQASGVQFWAINTGTTSLMSVTGNPDTLALLAQYEMQDGVLRLVNFNIPNDLTGLAQRSATINPSRLAAVTAISVRPDGASGNVEIAINGDRPIGVGIAMSPEPVPPFGPQDPPYLPPFTTNLRIRNVTLRSARQRDLWETIVPLNVTANPRITLKPTTAGGSLALRVIMLDQNNNVLTTITTAPGQQINEQVLSSITPASIAGQKLRFLVEQVGGNLGDGLYTMEFRADTTDPRPFQVLEPTFNFGYIQNTPSFPNFETIRNVTVNSFSDSSFTSSAVYNASVNGSTGSIDIFRFTHGPTPFSVQTEALTAGVNTNIKLYRGRIIGGSLVALDQVLGTAHNFDYFPADRSTIDARIEVWNTDLARDTFNGTNYEPGRNIWYAVVKNEAGSQGNYRLRVSDQAAQQAGPGLTPGYFGAGTPDIHVDPRTAAGTEIFITSGSLRRVMAPSTVGGFMNMNVTLVHSSGAAVARTYRLDVFDAAGALKQTTTLPSNGGQVTFGVSDITSLGTYFIRPFIVSGTVVPITATVNMTLGSASAPIKPANHPRLTNIPSFSIPAEPYARANQFANGTFSSQSGFVATGLMHKVVFWVDQPGVATFTLSGSTLLTNRALGLWRGSVVGGEQFYIAGTLKDFSSSPSTGNITLQANVLPGMYYLTVDGATSNNFQRVTVSGQLPLPFSTVITLDPNSGSTSAENLNRVDPVLPSAYPAEDGTLVAFRTSFYKVVTPGGSQAGLISAGAVYAPPPAGNLNEGRAYLSITRLTGSTLTYTGSDSSIDLDGSVDDLGAIVVGTDLALPNSEYYIAVSRDRMSPGDPSLHISAQYTIPQSGTPDIVVDGVRFAPANGRTLVTVDLRNNGYATAGAFKSKLRFSNYPTDSIFTIPGFGPLASQSFSYIWDPTNGTDTATYTADFENILAERNEGNNAASAALNKARPVIGSIVLAEPLLDGDVDPNVWGRYVKGVTGVANNIIVTPTDADGQADIYQTFFTEPGGFIGQVRKYIWVGAGPHTRPNFEFDGLSPTSPANPNRFGAYVQDQWGLTSDTKYTSANVVAKSKFFTDMKFDRATRTYNLDYGYSIVNYNQTLSQILGFEVPLVGDKRTKFILRFGAFGTATLNPAQAISMPLGAELNLTAFDYELYKVNIGGGTKITDNLMIGATLDVSGKTLDATAVGVSLQLRDLKLLDLDTGKIPLFSFGIPKVASISANFRFALKAGVSAGLKVGLNPQILVDPLNAPLRAGIMSPTFVQPKITATASISGDVEVLGFDVADLEGHIGLGLNVTVGLDNNDSSKVFSLDDFIDRIKFNVIGDLNFGLSAHVWGLGEVWSWEPDPIVFPLGGNTIEGIITDDPGLPGPFFNRAPRAGSSPVGLFERLGGSQPTVKAGSDLIGPYALAAAPQLVINPLGGRAMSIQVDDSDLSPTQTRAQLLFATRPFPSDPWSGLVALPSTADVANPVLARMDGFSGNNMPFMTVYEAIELPGNTQDQSFNDRLAARDLRYRTWNGTTWSGEFVLAGGAGGDSNQAIAFSPNGAGVAAWVHNDAAIQMDENGEYARDSQEIHAALWDAGLQTWTPGEALTIDGVVDSKPAVFAEDGKAYVVWIRENGTFNDLMFSTNAGAGWTTPAVLPITGLPAGGMFTSVALGSEAAGRVNVLFNYRVQNADRSLDSKLYNRPSTSAAFADPTTVEVIAVDTNFSHIRTTNMSSGALVVSWKAGDGETNEIFASTLTANATAWSKPIQLTQGTTIEQRPSVAVEPNGKFQVLYEVAEIGTGDAAASGNSPMVAGVGGTTAEARPELGFTKGLDFDEETLAVAGMTTPGRATIINRGLATTDVLIEYRRGPLNAPTVLSTRSVRLAPGATFDASYDYTMVGGEQLYSIRLSTTDVEMVGSADNISSYTLTGAVDLDVIALFLSNPNNAPGPGNPLVAQIRNRSNVALGAFAVNFRQGDELFPQNPWSSIGTVNVASLAAGAETLVTLPITVPSVSGLYEFSVYADSALVIDETTESNNRRSFRLSRQADPMIYQPPFSTAITATLINSSGVDNVQVNVGVINPAIGQGGAVSSGPVVVRLLRSIDDGDFVELAAQSFASVPVGGFAIPVVFITSGLAGDNRYRIVIDPQSPADDSNLFNNIGEARLQIRGLPDVMPQNVSLDTSSVLQGQPVILSVNVANLGIAAANDVLVEVIGRRPGEGGVTFGTLIIARIDPLSSQTVQIPLDTATLDGVYELIVVVNRANELLEITDENNSSAPITLTIIPDAGPFAQSSDYQFDAQPRPGFVIVFNEPIAGLDIADIELLPLATGVPIASGDLLLEMSPDATQTTITYTAAANGVLPDGNYRVTIAAGAFTDATLIPNPDPVSADFYVFAADANRDRTVNLDDFTVLAANFGLTGRVFSQGNFNYSLDGDVSLDDFTILAAQFGKTLPAAGDVPRNASVSDIARAPLRSRTSPFTTTRILDEVLDV